MPAKEPDRKPVPKPDAKIPSSASTGKPGKVDKDFAKEREAEHGAPLPSVSYSNDPVNAPPGAYPKPEDPSKADKGTKNKAGQPAEPDPKRSWE